MQCTCWDCASEWGFVMTPGAAAAVSRADRGGEGGDNGHQSPRWETDEYDFALDALEFQTNHTCLMNEDVSSVAPSIPTFRHDLDSPLTVGSHVIFSGTPDEDVQRVTFNIGVGEDVAVHVDARLPQRYVVRNSRRRGRWGHEETGAFSLLTYRDSGWYWRWGDQFADRKPRRPFPLVAGRPFVVEVLVGENDTLWSVDGYHYCEYAHRDPSPLAAASGHAASAASRWLELVGARDVSIDVNQADEYPKLAPPWPEVPSRSGANAPAVADEPSWAANARALLSRGVPEGSQLVVRGRLRALLHSFRVELCAGCQEWPRPDIALHFDLRAFHEPHRPRQLVVLNSRSDSGTWGEERRQRSAALVPGTAVTMRVVRGSAVWRVYADDDLLGELPFRIPPETVKAMRLRGDLLPSLIYLTPAPPADH